MLELLGILLGIVLVFLLFFWAAATFTTRAFARIAAQHGEQTQWLLGTGVAPPAWSEPQKKRVEELTAGGASPERVARRKERYKERLLARLERHLRYLERGNVFADEAMQRHVTDRIRAVGRTWEASSWDQIVGEEEFDLPASD